MPVELFSNQGQTTVTNGGTTAPSIGTVETWTVTSSASFPPALSGVSTGTGAFWVFHVTDPAAPSESVMVTNVAGTTWTVTRGADGTTPVTHAPGFTVQNTVPASVLTAMALNMPPRGSWPPEAASAVIDTPFAGQATPPATRLVVTPTFTASGGSGNNTDAVNYALGTFGVTAATSGAGGSSLIQGTFQLNSVNTPLNMLGKSLVIWMKRTTFSNFLGSYPRVCLGDTSLTNYYYWATKENPAQPWALDGEWIRMTLPFGAAHTVGSPNRASLAAITIQTFDASTGPATVTLGGVATMAEAATQWPHGVVSWTCDDGYASQFSVAAPYMDRYGQRATSYIITETLWNPVFGSYFTLAQARQLEQMNGWEMGVHSYTAYNHNASYTGISDAAALADMQAGKFWLLNNGFRCPETFCYPEGLYNDATMTNCLSNFASSLSISQNGDDPGETWPPADRARIRRVMIGPATVTATIQGYIDAAVANHQWLVLGWHDLSASPTGLQSLTSQFLTLVDYVASSGIACLPVSEVLKAPQVPQPCGVLTAPSVPATTVALGNPYSTDVTIYITAGASTCAVKLNATTVLTIPSAGVGTVRLESGATITLTYTSAPTWVWFGD
jgi:peptidoglycan/xylan/chitin deacetylase (PgdA/CDA1 family)